MTLERRSAPRLRAALVVLLLVATAAAAAPGTASKRKAKARAAGQARWTRVSYRELLDDRELLRNGDRLVDGLGGRAGRAVLQPHLERYSRLLPYAVQMLGGRDAVTQASLGERYPEGSAQPAWAALLRAGRLVVTAGGGRARVFVPGRNAKSAYGAHYSVLRHPLAAAAAGSPLAVEVYAYRNDYAAAELELDPVPYRFRASAFPAYREPLDLAALEGFFRAGGELRGAELSPGEGLVLYARSGAAPTLAGERVRLADFVTAYRAVFHAGDTQAFVSLDPNRDPTLATVNFGGYLEDTRVGQVALKADERFKTVCTGLEPDTREDVRPAVRRSISSFLSNAERVLLTGGTPSRQWVSTRYWFYPGSIQVDGDPDGRFAAIASARFTADAERMGSGGRARLAPEIRANIRHVNENFDRYAAAFPELRELGTVARLLAIATWLQRTAPRWLDLDGLLAVELPAVRTSREVPRVLSGHYLSVSPASETTERFVQERTRVRDFGRDLDRTVGEVFGGPGRMAAYLRQRAGSGAKGDPAAGAEALFEREKGKTLRTFLATEADLRAFLWVAGAAEVDPDREARARADAARLRELQAQIAAAAPAARAALEAELGAIVARYHGPQSEVRWQLQVTGGVSMEPRLFRVRRTPKSPALEELKAAARGRAGWVRSRPAAPASQVRKPPEPPRRAPATRAVPAGKPVAAPRVAPQAPAASPAAPAAPPKAAAPVLPKLEVPAAGGGLGAVVGTLGADGRIVFRPSDLR